MNKGMIQNIPDFTHEAAAMSGGAKYVCGVDEVGRGPLAGPVMAAAVILDAKIIPKGLNDSKKLTREQRKELDELIRKDAAVSVGEASVAEIDELNILQASLLAMRRAVEGLSTPPDHALVDGKFIPPGLACKAEALVKGDARSLSVAAASIAAKVRRDEFMAELARIHPGYGWERNAGYPTRAHLDALRSLGVTQHHRRTFAPVHNILCEEPPATP